MPSTLSIAATDKTPAVLLDHESGRFSIVGCSIPENADRFFSPIHDELERYASAPAKNTAIRIELSYFNSSTSKYLLDLLKCMEDLHASGRSAVGMEWYFKEGDLDMKEAGEDYRSLIDLPVKLRVIIG